MPEVVFRDSGFVSYEPNQDRWDEEQFRELVFNDCREHGGHCERRKHYHFGVEQNREV